MNDLYKDDPEQFLGTSWYSDVSQQKVVKKCAPVLGTQNLEVTKKLTWLMRQGRSIQLGQSNLDNSLVASRKRIAYQTLAEQSPYMKSAWAK